MSNDEYQHQNNWIDIRGKHKAIYDIVLSQIEKEFERFRLDPINNKSTLPRNDKDSNNSI